MVVFTVAESIVRMSAAGGGTVRRCDADSTAADAASALVSAVSISSRSDLVTRNMLCKTGFLFVGLEKQRGNLFRRQYRRLTP